MRGRREDEPWTAGFSPMGDVETEQRPYSVSSDRICDESGCRTVLSRYNDGSHCALHAPMQVPRTRGRKI